MFIAVIKDFEILFVYYVQLCFVQILLVCIHISQMNGNITFTENHKYFTSTLFSTYLSLLLFPK